MTLTKNNLLFLAATHGDEKIGVEILKKLNEKFNFNWIIANQKAFLKNKRFIDSDLNRVFPGTKYSKHYENKRAYQLNKILKKYNYIIDIHGTNSKTGIFTIITKPTKTNIHLASSLPIKNIIIWEPSKKRKGGPITQYINCGVEIECGPKNSKEIKEKLAKTIEKILKNYKSKQKKNIFKVYGKIKKENISKSNLKKLKEFKKITINQEIFYPLLINQYNDIACYKMKKQKL